MANSIPATMHGWLKREKLDVSKTLLKETLLSHPDYPSLLSITDTLDELDIPNTAVQIQKEQLPEIPVPFLAHLEGMGGEFVVVSNRDNLDAQFKNFYQRWSGVVVAAEKPENWKHDENTEYLKKDKNKKSKTVISVFMLLAIAGAATGISFSWAGLGLLLLAWSGLLISWLIVSKELGIANKLAEQACGKEAGCNAVIQSKGSKLPFDMKWSDVGLIWFASLFLLLTVASFTGSSATAYTSFSLFAVASLPFTFFSVWYQWRVVKKWCRLCLVTLGLLWLQFFILLPDLINLTKGGWPVLSPGSLLLVTALLISVAVVWLWAKQLITQNKNLENESFAARRVKNNPDVFLSYLEKQRKVDVRPWEGDLQLGNADAPLQIMVACNPYCGPCAQAHEVLHELMEKNEIGLTVRFAVKTENKEDKKTQAVAYLLQKIAVNKDDSPAYKRRLLHDWFAWMDFEKFIKTYPHSADSNNVTGLLKKHELWMENAKIEFTPTIFINGSQLPKQYSAADLKMLIKGVIETVKIEAGENEKQENHYTPV